MTDRLLPPGASNDAHVPTVAVAVFALVTVLTLARSLVHLLAPDGGAQSIATVPLDTFTENGAATVVHLFALWGLSQLVVALVYLAVLVRYRALIPLMFALMVAEYTGRLLHTFMKPFELTGTAPGAIGNWLMIPLAAGMVVLSLWGSER